MNYFTVKIQSADISKLKSLRSEFSGESFDLESPGETLLNIPFKRTKAFFAALKRLFVPYSSCVVTLTLPDGKTTILQGYSEQEVRRLLKLLQEYERDNTLRKENE